METTKLSNDFDQKYGAKYREGSATGSQPTQSGHSFNEGFSPVENGELLTSSESAAEARQLAQEVMPVNEPLMLFDHPVVDYINTMLPNGAPVNSRHQTALKLANDLFIMLDGDKEKVRQQLLALQWVKDVVTERGEGEIDRIIESAQQRHTKREADYLSPQPSQNMRKAIEFVTKRKYKELVTELSNAALGDMAPNQREDIIPTLEAMGQEMEKYFRYYPMLRMLCHGVQRKHYIAALFVGGAYAMTLMTRCWYQFWPAPGRRNRLNCLLELIGRMGSGKHILVDIYKIMMEPIKEIDKAQEEALNKWNEEREQNSGSSKNKAPRPKGIYRSLPCESSAAAIREAEFNAKEIVDGEEVSLHISITDSELDNTLRQMKRGYMDIQTLWLKAFHNEPQGAFMKTSSSRVGEYDVHANFMYSGTDFAINKQVNINNYATGLVTRIAAIPMGESNFEMMQNREYTEADAENDKCLRDIAYDLDSTKGEIPVKEISNALHKWTERRMFDAKENDSKAEEDLLKRPCWVAINFALPFIVNRHWDQMIEDGGRMKCKDDFKTDKTDVKFAIFIANAQWCFQQYFFKAIAEQHYENCHAQQIANTHMQEHTRLAYMRLPNPCTSQDIDRQYGYNGKQGSICSRLKRLQDDGLLLKIAKGEDKGKYRKLA